MKSTTVLPVLMAGLVLLAIDVNAIAQNSRNSGTWRNDGSRRGTNTYQYRPNTYGQYRPTTYPNTFGQGWFTQTPHYQQQNEDLVEYPPPGSDTRVNVGKIISDAMGLATQHQQYRPNTHQQYRPNTHQQYRPNTHQQYRPNTTPHYHYYQQQVYPQQFTPQVVYPSAQLTIPPPPSTAPLPPAAPSNNIVKTQKKPASNAFDSAKSGFNLTSETDAQQAVEAEDATEQLTTAMSGYIAALQSPAVAEDWERIVQDGVMDEDVEAFLNKYGPNGTDELNQFVVEGLELRQNFAAYAKALVAGGLTNADKDLALDHLRRSVDQFRQNALANVATSGGYFFASLDENLDNMSRFNDLGKLNELAWETDNPVAIVIQGVNAAGLGPALATDMTGLPIYPVAPIADIAIPSSGNLVSTVLYSPKSNSGPISYLLDSQSFTMQPGEQQKLYGTYTVSFDPGDGSDSKRYRLSTGNYEWRLDGTRWEIVRVRITATLDASGFDRDFHYLLNNQECTLPARERTEHASSTPMEIVFDRGDGGEPVRKLLKSKTYVVGIDSDQSRVDLFAAEDVEQSVAKDPQLAAAVNRVKHGQLDADERVKELLQRIKRAGQPMSRLTQTTTEELLERLSGGRN